MASTDRDCFKEYLKGINKEQNLVLSGRIDEKNILNIAKSSDHWASKYQSGKAGYGNYSPKKGEIYQFEFGRNYEPEMSYEHRGLVLGVRKKLLYVLPIYSYIEKKHTDVYHPDDFPDSKSDLYLLKAAEYDFLDHDSVLKINDLRTVSQKRILFSQKARMDINSEESKHIEEMTFNKCFPGIYHEYIRIKKENQALKSSTERNHEEDKAKGAAKREREIVLNMVELGWSVDVIAKALHLTEIDVMAKYQELF